MSSMDEVDGAYLNQRLVQLEKKVKLQDDLHTIEKTKGRRWSLICWVVQVVWLLACTVLVTIIITHHIPEIDSKVENLLPVGTILAWLPEDTLPEGRILIRFY